MVEDRAAGDQEIPGLDAVGQVMDAAEAGLIVADELLQAEVHADCMRGRGVMEVEDRDGGIGPVDLGFLVGDVLSDQMLVGQCFLGVDDDRGDPCLPLEGDAAEVGLVADLEVEVVKGVQLGDGLADECLLDLLEVLVFEGIGFFRLILSQAVGVIAGVHRIDSPQIVVIEGCRTGHTRRRCHGQRRRPRTFSGARSRRRSSE